MRRRMPLPGLLLLLLLLLLPVPAAAAAAAAVDYVGGNTGLPAVWGQSPHSHSHYLLLLQVAAAGCATMPRPALTWVDCLMTAGAADKTVGGAHQSYQLPGAVLEFPRTAGLPRCQPLQQLASASIAGTAAAAAADIAGWVC